MVILTYLLLLSNFLVTYQGFKYNSFFKRYDLRIGPILSGDYRRGLTSAFLHVSWQHFVFNMFTLWAFGSYFEMQSGFAPLLLVYSLSLFGSSAFVVLMYKKYSDYSAVGASGAISGLVNASIVLYPEMEIGLFYLIFIPAWLYGFGYTIYSIRGMLKRNDGICHEGHFGGGLVGLLIGIIMEPSAVIHNYVPIMCVFAPSVFFLIYYFFFRGQPGLFSIASWLKKVKYSSSHPKVKIAKSKNKPTVIDAEQTQATSSDQSSMMRDDDR